MKPLVIDCSVAMSWCFEDEAGDAGEDVLGLFGKTEVWVPSLWALEVANVLTVSERRERITQADSVRFIDLLRSLPVLVDDQTHSKAWEDTLSLAREHGLSTYDAAYIELAMRKGARLSTLDDKLNKAARNMGVPLFHTHQD